MTVSSSDDSATDNNEKNDSVRREELFRCGLTWAHLAIVWAVIETILAFLVGSRADSTMLVALAHVTTVDILTCLIGRAQIAALLNGEGAAFGDYRHESLAFAIVGVTSLVAALSVSVRTLLHFHPAAWSVSHTQYAEAMTIAGSSTLVWYVLARLKRGVAVTFQSEALHADANGAFYSACVAGGVLLALALLWFALWAQLDSVSALLIGGLLIWQGMYGVRTALQVHRRARDDDASSRVSHYAPR